MMEGSWDWREAKEGGEPEATASAALVMGSGDEVPQEQRRRIIRRVESGELRVERRELRVESGELRVERRERRVERREWRVERRGWRVES